MVRSSSSVDAIHTAVERLIDEYHLDDPSKILFGCLHILRSYLVPFVLGCSVLTCTYPSMKRLEQWVFPPTPRVRYQTAIALYQRGQIRPALKEFRKLMDDDRYGKAALSLAVHEIYVAGSPTEGLRLLKEARSKGLRTVPATTINSMQEDAKSIMGGDAVMVGLNAKMAKQDYLGIVEG